MGEKADRLRDLLRLANVLRTSAGDGPYQDHAALFVRTAEALERNAQEIAFGKTAIDSVQPPQPVTAARINLIC